MNKDIVIIFLIYLLPFSVEGLDIIRVLEFGEKKSDGLLLQTAKLHIIRGEIHRAEPDLRKIFGKDVKIAMIKKYYQAMIDFIQGDYKKSFLKLEDKRFLQNRRYHRQVCLLQLLNMMAIGAGQEKLKDYFTRCRDITARYSKNRQLFLSSLMDVHLYPAFQRNPINLGNHFYVLEDYNVLKTWIKTVFYLNQQDDAFKGFLIFPDDAYYSKSIRELMGFVHYRYGEFKKAYSFLEDIDSPNTKNIKGGLAIEKKNYTEAFDHFKKALETKYNSVNAYLRLISLSWYLKKWEEGLYYTELLISKLIDPKELEALKTAFLIKLDRPFALRQSLNRLQSLHKEDLPFDIEIMNTYGHILVGNKKAALQSSDILCEKLDGLSCLIHSYLNIWPDIGKTLNRDDKVYDDPHLTFDMLKVKQEKMPLKEIVYIDQKDIDELDEISFP